MDYLIRIVDESYKEALREKGVGLGNSIDKKDIATDLVLQLLKRLGFIQLAAEYERVMNE